MKKLALLLLAILAGPSGADESTSIRWVGDQVTRRTIYHSPQTPGYTCWLGAWIMPDKSLMISFTQNTGPVDRTGRAPAEVLKKFPMLIERPKRDAMGLKKANLYMRSTDRGATWQLVGEAPFDGPLAYCAPGGQEAVLNDGSVLRGVFGYFLPTMDVPQSAFLQRSTDGCRTWSKPQILGDPSKETWRLTRLRRLRDGRLIATGGRSRVPSTSPIAQVWRIWEPLLIVSEDDGRTWSSPIDFLPKAENQGWLEEWDTAELASGDLLCVFRRVNPDKLIDDPAYPGRKVARTWNPSPKDQIRWQAVLVKDGKTWRLGPNGPAPFPHSGHPELLATREGPVLHIATSGVDLTGDGGQTWSKLSFPHLKDAYRSRYYPKSVQADDGTIYVFGHTGGDDDFGSRDQAVFMDTFRLARH